jgi:hypothetical protein
MLVCKSNSEKQKGRRRGHPAFLIYSNSLFKKMTAVFLLTDTFINQSDKDSDESLQPTVDIFNLSQERFKLLGG